VDIIKLAMLRLESALKDTGAKLILQVHDELVFEVPEAQLDKIKELVREKMENVVQLKVPLKVGIGSGKNWQEAH
jgi:DNA polymerase-1